MANTYDTSSEPLGSTAPKVLYNNASNLDDAMNSTLPSWTDRPPFNRERLTLWGAEQQWQEFLQNSGYEPVHLLYTDGVPLVVDRPTQLFDRAGISYRIKLPATFPVTLTGVWATDLNSVVEVSDEGLRQDLATQGIAMIKNGSQTVNSISALRALLKTSVSQYAFVLGYYAAGDGGGGPYYLDAADTMSADNGGSVIVATDGARWKIAQVGPMDLRQWGCKGDNVTDDTARYMAAVNSGLAFDIPEGQFKVGPVGPTVSYPTGSEPNRTSGAVLSTGQNVRGLGAKSELIWNNATNQAFFGVTNAKNIVISGVKFTGGYAPFIVDPTSDGSVDNVGLLDCIVEGCITGPIGGRQLALDPASKYCSNIWMEGCDLRNITVHAFIASNCYRPRVHRCNFENIPGGYCFDFSQGCRGGVASHNTANSVKYFGKFESSNSYVGGGTINGDPTVAESRDCAAYGNVVTDLQEVGLFMNSGCNRHSVVGNVFNGSITNAIWIGSVTGYVVAGQTVIANNVINSASTNAVGVKNQMGITTHPVIVSGNEINGGSIGIDWPVDKGRILNNNIDTIDVGVQIGANVVDLDIRGNNIRSNSTITSTASGGSKNLKIVGNTLTPSTWAAYFGSVSNLSNAEFSGNVVNNSVVRASPAVLVPNPRSVRFSNNTFNLATGSASSIGTTGTSLKSIIAGNIATVGFSIAGPDASTTANTVNNIVDAVYVA